MVARSDLRGGYTVPTPAADDKRVFVVFGSSVLAAFDHAGQAAVAEGDRPTDFDVAMASSPVLYRGSVILQLDGVKPSSRLVAYDAQVRRGEVEAGPAERRASATARRCWRRSRAGRNCSWRPTNAVQGVDPEDGKLLWWCEAAGDTASPVFGGGLVYCDSGRGGMGVCVDPTGRGDVTQNAPQVEDRQRAAGLLVAGGRRRHALSADRSRRAALVGTEDRRAGATRSASRASARRPARSPRRRAASTSPAPARASSCRRASKLKHLAANDLGDPVRRLARGRRRADLPQGPAVPVVRRGEGVTACFKRGVARRAPARLQMDSPTAPRCPSFSAAAPVS